MSNLMMQKSKLNLDFLRILVIHTSSEIKDTTDSTNGHEKCDLEMVFKNCQN